MRKEKREKKPFKVWEKVFIGLSLLMVLVTFTIYGVRLIHYYKIEHPKDMDNSIATYIKKNDTVLSGDGLYSFDEKEYVYKGKELNNYLWYNGILWQIINIKNNELKLITANSLTDIVWGKEQTYTESYINKWLTSVKYLKNIKEEDLVLNTWCVGNININDPVCNETREAYVGLLSVKDYLDAGGKNSYLNNEEYFWTANESDKKAYYVFSFGGLNNEVSSIDSFYSYGIRPVIILKNRYEYYGGDGSLESPYRLNEPEKNIIGEMSVGEYIKFSNYTWRVLEKNETSSKIVMEGYVNDKTYTFSNAISYLNKNFYNSLKKDKLEKCTFNTGSYGKNTNYDYANTYSKTVTQYVGLPSVSELFSNDYVDTWLYNAYEGNTNLQYKINSSNRLMGDINSNKNKVRAVICIKNDTGIVEGTGLKDNPYQVEE